MQFPKEINAERKIGLKYKMKTSPINKHAQDKQSIYISLIQCSG